MDLVERLKRKEEAAVIEMMNKYGDSLLRTAILLVKDPHLAEEIVQDTFVMAYQKIYQLHDEQKLKSWLLMITTNGCRARMRKWSWKNIFLHQEQEQEDHLIDEHELLPEETLIATWRDQQLREAITLLPYHYREVITLYYFQELTVKEIALLIKENENTVKTRLARARALLKVELTKGGVGIAK
ncbi:sigma-70 family RNA polymerase sigma factor [Anaerobacillus alkaliphilus]|uniref:RNA polymerase sigma factor n=1 Tax=Anaerobacillus alkaliphilus TaxID=1548597 RepID=A0A4Q0VMK0_9BACI|nr:sigma-70 family RNA polymerase sigma factor [Anaerobacillus alkaliphilus]RXI96186.1 sigma-70 family RNA polymerase sigma factor [Anaerobacillus alkaliphilus]